jgi:hypothetical protein
VSDAQRGEVFYQRFQRTALAPPGGVQPMPIWTASGSREILTPGVLASRLQADEFVVGPGVERYHAEFMSSRVALRLQACEADAASVARLGECCRDSQQCDAWSLLPEYGRLSSAEEKRGDQLHA